MFKIIYLKLEAHPQLGDIEFNFVADNEINNVSKPYTSVIIGSNGTGKSYLLRTIAEIFRAIYAFKTSKHLRTGLGFKFHLKYKIGSDKYDVLSRSLFSFSNSRKSELIFMKNIKVDSLLRDKAIQITLLSQFEINSGDLKLPSNVIVSSIMLNDRFTFSDSQPNDFYQYLGIRRTPSITSTKTFQKKTIKYLFDASRSNNFTHDLEEMLGFMGFDQYFKVHYNTKYNSLFFSGNLNKKDFKMFFEKWWESNHTNRKQDNPLWGKWYYDKLVKENPKEIETIIDYLNLVAKDGTKVLHKPRSKSKLFEVDLFGEFFYQKEFELIESLVKLDILNLDGIKIKKRSSELSIDQTSSGEYHLIISLLGLYSKIQQSSLILIDEPEISLHPNWQMQYINFLKRMFKKYSSCHFIITTHSHFLVSDLENDSSSVIMIKRGEKSLESSLLEGSTYGWPADQVLLKVFETASDRNFYLSEKLSSVFELIAKEPNARAIKEIKDQVQELRELDIKGLSDTDPLKDVVTELLKRF